MKKEYKKPQIFMETFKVSEFIAANCSADGGVSISELENGQYNFGGISVFNANRQCKNDVNEFDYGQYDQSCYDIPIQSLSLYS